MESLEERTQQVICKLKANINPAVKANTLGVYLADGLREKQISLYEAYLIEEEKIAFERMAYTQPAWGQYGHIHISDLIELLNVKMLSLLFQNKAGACLWDDWARKAYQVVREKRPHYILDEYLSFLDADKDPTYLQRLLEVRTKKRRPFGKGPYHDERFPYQYCNYEGMLLEKKTLKETPDRVCEPVTELLTEIFLME